MRSFLTRSRLARGCVALATLLILSACAGTPPAATTAPQERSPLAAPPASMMTPHGY